MNGIAERAELSHRGIPLAGKCIAEFLLRLVCFVLTGIIIVGPAGCASSPRIPLSDYLGPHSGARDGVVRIAAVGVRAPRPQDLVVDLAFEGPLDDVGWVTHSLWGHWSRWEGEEWDWITVSDPAGRTLKMKRLGGGGFGPPIGGSSIVSNDDEGRPHVRTLVTFAVDVPVFYFPSGGVYRVELHPERIASRDYVSHRRYEVNTEGTTFNLQRGTIESDLPWVAFYPIRSGATLADYERLTQRLREHIAEHSSR